MEIIYFLFIYTILLISILGYGFLFSSKITTFNNYKLSDVSIGIIGIFGIFVMIFLSYLTNLFVPQ